MVNEAITNFRLRYEGDLLKMENRLRLLTLSLLEKPVNLMRE